MLEMEEQVAHSRSGLGWLVSALSSAWL